MPTIFLRLIQYQQAATLIEYSLIVTLIATVTVSGMAAVATGIKFNMGSAANGMN